MEKEENKSELRELVELVFSGDEVLKNQVLDKLKAIGEEVLLDFLTEELFDLSELPPLEFLRIFCQFHASVREHKPEGEKPFVAKIDATLDMIASGSIDYLYADKELNEIAVDKINKLGKETANREENISMLQQIICLYPPTSELMDWYVVSEAIDTLGTIEGTEAEEALLDIFLDSYHNRDTRKTAVSVLKKIGGERTVDTIINVLESTRNQYWDMKIDAIKVLGEIDSPRLKQVLEQAFNKVVGWEERRAIKDILNKLEPKYVINKVDDAKITLQALLDSEDEQASSKITELLRHKDLSVKEYTIIALGSLRDKRAIPYLVNCFNDNEDGEIWQTIIALAKIVKRSEIPKLLREHPLDLNSVDLLTDFTDKMIPLAREFIIEVDRKIYEIL